MFLPFINFKGLKCFRFFSSLTNSKKDFCLWDPHLIFSVRSHLPKEGIASEANSHVHVPQMGPCILELRLQPLLRGSALLLWSAQHKGRLCWVMPDVRMYSWSSIRELCSPAEIPHSLNNPTQDHKVTAKLLLGILSWNLQTLRWATGFNWKP